MVDYVFYPKYVLQLLVRGYVCVILKYVLQLLVLTLSRHISLQYPL
jgi:hypothetical protein